MKIICPHHNGLAEIKEDDLLSAFRNPMQTTELNCPICNGQLFIHNVCMENKDSVNAGNKSSWFKSRKRSLE